MTFDFVEIKVHESWEVLYSKLTSLDPTDDSLSKEELQHYSLGLLTDDILQIKSKSHFIDMEWSPDADITGAFHLQLLPFDEKNGVDWANVVYEFETRSLQEILLCIEIITNVLKS